jgi:hypothetical protein
MAGSGGGINWGLLAKVFLVVALIVGGLVMWPGIQCSMRVMNGAELGGLYEDQENQVYGGRGSDESSDTGRVASAGSFVGRFFGGIVPCGRQALLRAETWQPPVAGGAFLGFFLFSWFNHLSWKRGVVKAARNSTTRAHAVAGGTTSANPTVSTTATASRTAANTAVGSTANRTTANTTVTAAANRTTSAHSSIVAPTTRATSAESAIGSPSSSRSGGPTAQHRSLPGDPVGTNLGFDDGSASRRDGSRVRIPVDPLSSMGGPAPRTPLKSGSQRAVTFSFDDDWDDAPLPEEALALPNGGPYSPDVAGAAPFSNPRSAAPSLVNAPTMADVNDFGRASARVALSANLPAADVTNSPVSVRAFRIPPMSRLGRDIQLAIGLSRPAPDALPRMRIVGVLHGKDRARTPILDESIESLDGVDDLRRQGKAIVRVPFRLIERSLQRAFDSISGHLRIEFTLSLDDDEHYAGTELVDSMTIRLASASGGLWGPGVVKLRSPDGQILRVGVGESGTGMLRLESIMPGEWQLEFEDDLRLHAADGPPTRRVSLKSDAVDAVDAGLPANAPGLRELMVAAPVIVWVRAGASGEGSFEHPSGSIEDAFVNADRQRARLGVSYTPVEIRIFPNGTVPAERPGIVDGVRGQWLKWWSGQPSDRRTPWTVSGSDLPEIQTPRGDTFARPLHFESVDDLRIVNAEYALLREKAALNQELREQLDMAYAQIPIVTFFPPESTGDGTRVRLDHCRCVRLEGVQVIGMRGMNALTLNHCEEVVVSRCWFERAAAGHAGHGGGWSPGRGVQIDASGTEHAPIEFSDCDIGWNSVVRRSVPVRGAAMAAYDSHVVIARCYLHDNAATQEPPDVFGSGTGSLRGDSSSHRAGNYVADT